MMENNFRKTVFAGMVVLIAALGSGTMVLAQDAQPQGTQAQEAQPEAAQAQPQQPQAMLDTTGKTSVSIHGAFGAGFSSVDVGTTTSGETVKISGGGGAGFGVGIGYGITRKFDVDLALGGQASVLTPAVKNAEGTFTRTYLLATLKRKFRPRTRASSRQASALARISGVNSTWTRGTRAGTTLRWITTPRSAST